MGTRIDIYLCLPVLVFSGNTLSYLAKGTFLIKYLASKLQLQSQLLSPLCKEETDLIYPLCPMVHS